MSLQALHQAPAPGVPPSPPHPAPGLRFPEEKGWSQPGCNSRRDLAASPRQAQAGDSLPMGFYRRAGPDGCPAAGSRELFPGCLTLEFSRRENLPCTPPLGDPRRGARVIPR